MIVGPASTTLSSVAVNGYAVAADVSSLYEGVFFWLAKTGETSKYCVVTEIDRGTKTIGIRFVEDKVSGRSDVTAYNGGTVAIPQQLWSNPDGDNTYGSAEFNGNVTINNNLTIYGILSLPQYATADLPTASSYLGGIAYDTTTETPVFSDGSVWAAIGGGATSIADLRADPDKSLVNSDLFNRLAEYQPFSNIVNTLL